jgi:hypothetical protein
MRARDILSFTENIMLNTLEAIERDFPLLLGEPDEWSSKLIDYHPPKVERLWRQVGENRIALHRIWPCAAEDALWHPHNWPAAMRILDGTYEMGVSFGQEEPAGLGAKMLLNAGSAYEMTHPHGWHYVRPVGGPVLTVP